ncbi:MAG: hypothetical protein HY869_06580 [Chloroflexi bacterium]|nr:hypothetical protein [Chloroflexota bacterium]
MAKIIEHTPSKLVIEQQFNRLVQQERVKQTMLEDFAAFCHKIKANLENPTPQLKQEVIRLLIDHVVVGENEIAIKHVVPTDDDCRLKPGHRDVEARSFLLVFSVSSWLSG